MACCGKTHRKMPVMHDGKNGGNASIGVWCRNMVNNEKPIKKTGRK